MRLPGAANISENSPTHLLWGQSPNVFYLLVNKHENGKPFFGNRFLVKILPCCIAIRVWINIPTPRTQRVQYSILYCCYVSPVGGMCQFEPTCVAVAPPRFVSSCWLTIIIHWCVYPFYSWYILIHPPHVIKDCVLRIPTIPTIVISCVKQCIHSYMHTWTKFIKLY